MTKLAACLKDNGLLIFWSRGNAASPLSLPGFLLTVVSDRVLCHVYSDSGTSIFPLCWAAGAVGEELLPMGWTHVEQPMEDFPVSCGRVSMLEQGQESSP